MTETRTPTLDFVLDLAKQAGEIILEAGRRQKQISNKESRSDVVTETDILIEKFLIQKIQAIFPDHKFYCEETTHDALTNAPTWIIDPIDGTANFVHTHTDHSCSIGYAVNKQALIGVITFPMRGETFYAEKGKGAFLNGQPIHVAPRRTLPEAIVATGFFVGHLHSKKDADNVKVVRDIVISNFISLIDSTADIRRSGGAAYDLSSVACGRVDAYAEFGIWAWDICAGKIIVEEAGGILIDYEGNPWHLGSRHIIAASSVELAKAVAGKLKGAPLDGEF